MTSHSGSEPPRRYYAKGTERRHEILDRAIELFATQGVEGASLRTIADSLGVSHTALRHYFPTREALLIEVYRHHETYQTVETAERDDVGAVEHLARYADRNRQVPGLVQLYSALSTSALDEQGSPTREFIRDRFRNLRQDMADRLAAPQETGDTAAAADATDLAALIIAASDGLQVQWLVDPDSVDVRRSLELLERLLRR